jgi:hypothetical protein
VAWTLEQIRSLKISDVAQLKKYSRKDTVGILHIEIHLILFSVKEDLEGPIIHSLTLFIYLVILLFYDDVSKT